MPVCTESPWITVVWPTRTPGTSVIAFHWPGVSVPGTIPSSRGRTFCCAAELGAMQQTRSRQYMGRKRMGTSDCGWGIDRGFQAVEQLALCRIHLFSCLLRRKPGTPIHFREGERAPGAARPLRCHRVAGDPLGIGVALPGPGMHHLAGFLPNCAERSKGAFRTEAGFLFELPAGGGEQIFARLGDALRDGPRANVPALPERTARMGEEYLHPTGASAVEQQPSAHLGRQDRTLRAQKYPAGSGSVRPLLWSWVSSNPGSAFHQPQNPSCDTAVIVSCSTYDSRLPLWPNRRCEPASTAPG